jgi:hypothetical protein
MSRDGRPELRQDRLARRARRTRAHHPTEKAHSSPFSPCVAVRHSWLECPRSCAGICNALIFGKRVTRTPGHDGAQPVKANGPGATGAAMGRSATKHATALRRARSCGRSATKHATARARPGGQSTTKHATARRPRAPFGCTCRAGAAQRPPVAERARRSGRDFCVRSSSRHFENRQQPKAPPALFREPRARSDGHGRPLRRRGPFSKTVEPGR